MIKRSNRPIDIKGFYLIGSEEKVYDDCGEFTVVESDTFGKNDIHSFHSVIRKSKEKFCFDVLCSKSRHEIQSDLSYQTVCDLITVFTEFKDWYEKNHPVPDTNKSIDKLHQ